MERLTADAVIEEAMRRTGLSEFDSDSFREGLEVYLEDVNAGNPPPPVRERLREDAVKHLANRLKVADYLRKRPELLERPIVEPVFVFGMPRTGTTLLSNLLAADPAHRSPLTWEIDDPVPPPTRETLYTDPRALARLEEERRLLAAHPEMGKYYRSSAIYPNECVYFMAHDFKTLMLESRCTRLIYRDWLFSTDMRSAYAYHRKFLQVLQAEAPGTWNLKMPSHALWLDTLVATYPDAKLIWTHRDPFTALGSFCSIIALSHRRFSGGVSPEWVGQNCLWQAQQHLERIMDFRERAGEERIVDVHYADLVTDPIGTMRALYAKLGKPFTEAAEAGMRAWLADNPQDKFGRHEYRLAQFGLSVEKAMPAFERYLARYEVAREG